MSMMPGGPHIDDDFPCPDRCGTTGVEPKWFEYIEPCSRCEGEQEVYTTHKKRDYGWVIDGDRVRCKSCDAAGKIRVDDADQVCVELDGEHPSDNDWESQSAIDGEGG